jgi:histidyl-tRNA synthetase
VVHQSTRAEGARYAFGLAEKLRNTGLEVVLHCGGGSFKSQMKKADGSGAEFAVIVGDEELAAGEATLKALRSEAAQERIKADQLAARIIELLPEEQEN